MMSKYNDMEWIPITDNLPETGEDVLIYKKDGSDYCIKIGHLGNFDVLDEFSRKISTITVWYTDDDYFPIDSVIYWKPCPTPPKVLTPRYIDANKAIRDWCGRNCGCEPSECGHTFEEDGTEACTFVDFLNEQPTVKV